MGLLRPVRPGIAAQEAGLRSGGAAEKGGEVMGRVEEEHGGKFCCISHHRSI